MDQQSKYYFYEVSPTKKFGRDISLLTYQSQEQFDIGDLVEVPLGKSSSAGVVISRVTKPDFTCRDITKKLFPAGLPSELVKLAVWMSSFYSTGLATVWTTILPSRLLKNRKITDMQAEQKMCSIDNNAKQLTLTKSQSAALDQIRNSSSGTIILRGITGSGKTEIYKRLALDKIKGGKNVIVLVPEISLTTQLAHDFQAFLAEQATILTTNSAQADKARFASWLTALTPNRHDDKPIVAIGPRSALFLPLRNIGLIIIDEEHESTYNQDKAPRYNTKTVAAKLADLHSGHDSACKLILGSATPAITDIFTAKKLNRSIVEMTGLAQTNATPAEINIVDMKNRDNFNSESRIFSRKLLEEMRQTLDDNGQVLLFHNRRGTAGTTLCENCGWISMCPNCFLPLTLHADRFELRCHICGFHDKVPTSCPICGHPDIIFRGIGTKKIEDEVHRIFDSVGSDRKNALAVRRFDGDTSITDSVARVYSELRDGSTKIIIGTQQIAKGLDLPHLGLVGVVQADAGLNLPDFGARERTFQLITQAIGRVGRTSSATKAIIQTFQPDAAAIKFARNQDFWGFYDDEIKERARGHFPPFAHLLKITCTYKTESSAVQNSRHVADKIRRNFAKDVFVLGPSPSFYERMRNNYRWQVVVRSASRATLNAIAQTIAAQKSAKNWTVEIDPVSLI